MHFTISTLVILAAVLSLANPIFAWGPPHPKKAEVLLVNCKGGAGCYFARWQGNIAQKLANYMDKIDRKRHYNDGEHIACQSFGLLIGLNSHICAFVQKAGGATGENIHAVSVIIPLYGCEICGSVDLNYPESAGGGILTYNVVSRGACRDGLC